MLILVLVDVETGTATPLPATVRPARAGWSEVQILGLSILVSPDGRRVIRQAIRIPPLASQERADA
jgi:hypothetical protein